MDNPTFSPLNVELGNFYGFKLIPSGDPVNPQTLASDYLILRDDVTAALPSSSLDLNLEGHKKCIIQYKLVAVGIAEFDYDREFTPQPEAGVNFKPLDVVHDELYTLQDDPETELTPFISK